MATCMASIRCPLVHARASDTAEAITDQPGRRGPGRRVLPTLSPFTAAPVLWGLGQPRCPWGRVQAAVLLADTACVAAAAVISFREVKVLCYAHFISSRIRPHGRKV